VRLKTNILVPICKNALKYRIGAGSKLILPQQLTKSQNSSPFQNKNGIIHGSEHGEEILFFVFL